MRERNDDFPNVWTALLIVALLTGIEIVIAGGFYDAGMNFTPGDPRASVINVLGFGVVLSALLSYKHLSWGCLFNPAGASAGALMPLLVPLLGMTAGAVVLAVEVGNVLELLFPRSGAELEDDAELFTGGIVSLITLCVVAPFVEEMLFRGVFLRAFLGLYSPALAIVLSALLFGFAHLNIHQFVIASALGLVLGWLYYATGSLWPSIVGHAAYNGGIYAYARSFPDAGAGVLGGFPLHDPSTLVIALVAFGFGLVSLAQAIGARFPAHGSWRR